MGWWVRCRGVEGEMGGGGERWGGLVWVELAGWSVGEAGLWSMLAANGPMASKITYRRPDSLYSFLSLAASRSLVTTPRSLHSASRRWPKSPCYWRPQSQEGWRYSESHRHVDLDTHGGMRDASTARTSIHAEALDRCGTWRTPRDEQPAWDATPGCATHTSPMLPVAKTFLMILMGLRTVSPEAGCRLSPEASEI